MIGIGNPWCIDPGSSHTERGLKMVNNADRQRPRGAIAPLYNILIPLSLEGEGDKGGEGEININLRAIIDDNAVI